VSDTFEAIKKVVMEQLTVDESAITESASFIDDLGADSLDIVEIVMGLEDEFGFDIPDEDAEKLKTIGEAIKYIEANK
jgi:acyl carrier protein